MKRSFSIIVLVVVCSSTMRSQSSVIEFSGLSTGFSILPVAGGTLTSTAGDQIGGTVVGENTRIESGFINNVLLGNIAIALVVRSEGAVLGRPVGVNVVLPPTIQTFAESLFYRKGGEHAFNSLALVRTEDTLVATLPSTASTIRGIEFYLSLFSARGEIRFPSVGVDTIRVTVNVFTSPLTLDSRRYRMISVPAELHDASLAGVLADDYGEYNPLLWRVFRWRHDRNVEYPQLDARFTPGTAFWLITQSGTGFDIDNGKSVPSLSPISITLDTGWNQIANPFAFPVSLTDVLRSGQISELYFYDGTSPYIPHVTVMKPWEGYFIENRSPEQIVLDVPPLEAPPSAPRTSAYPVPIAANDFVLQLSAELEGTALMDVYNYIGFRENALEGDDILDQREPPAMSEHVQLSILDGRSYLSNYKPLPTDGAQWQVSIASSVPDRRVIVRLTEFGSLPDGFSLYVLDKDDFNAAPVADGSFSLLIRNARRSLKVMIGTKKYAEEHNDGIPLVPLAYALYQNYPNPFNPSTTIRYQLNKRSSVLLEVFNLLGQRVRTLVNSEQLTGSYAVSWSGENDRGNRVASGVYIYRVRAGDFIATKKMLMLR